MLKNKDRLRVRNATMEDLPALLWLEEIAWPEDARASRDTYISRLETFPEGIFIGEKNGNIEGAAVTQIISSELLKEDFTWDSITDGGTIRRTHDPNGDVVYGVNLSVKPDCMGNGVISAIMNAIAVMAIKRNLRIGALGGRLPGLKKYFKRKGLNPDDIPPTERDELVRKYIFGTTSHGRPLDPEIAIYQRSGLKPVKPLRGYFPDPPSLDYGVLLIWENPLYDKRILRRLITPFLAVLA